MAARPAAPATHGEDEDKMTEGETAPAGCPKQDADAYLAACSALLLAIAENTYVDAEHLGVLVASMPDYELSLALAVGFQCHDLVPSTAQMEHG